MDSTLLVHVIVVRICDVRCMDRMIDVVQEARKLDAKSAAIKEQAHKTKYRHAKDVCLLRVGDLKKIMQYFLDFPRVQSCAPIIYIFVTIKTSIRSVWILTETNKHHQSPTHEK